MAKDIAAAYASLGISYSDRERLAKTISDRIINTKGYISGFYRTMNFFRSQRNHKSMVDHVDAAMMQFSRRRLILRKTDGEFISVTDFLKKPGVGGPRRGSILRALKANDIYQVMQRTPITQLPDEVWSKLQLVKHVSWKGVFPLLVAGGIAGLLGAQRPGLRAGTAAAIRGRNLAVRSILA